jgi:hypothetical protein
VECFSAGTGERRALDSQNKKLTNLLFLSRLGHGDPLRSGSGMGKALPLVRLLIVKSAEFGLVKEPKNVPNPWVQFRIKDIYIPEPAQVLMELHGKEELLGRVIDMSASQIHDEAFAVVEVEGLSQPVVVATKHLKEIGCE